MADPGVLEAIQRTLGNVGGAVGDVVEGAANLPADIIRGVTSPISAGPGMQFPDRGAVGNALIRTVDAISRASGGVSPIEQAIQRHQAQVQQRKQQFAQNLQVLERMGGFLDQLPIGERPKRTQQLRERFESEFGGEGSGELFDAVLGDLSLAPGYLEQLKQDPEVAALLQNPRASGADLQALTNSPEFRARAIDRQDSSALKGIEGKIRSWFEAASPSLRAALEQAQADGQITAAEIRRLNEVAGQGPGGLSLSEAELGTLDRRQGDIAARIPGFATTSDFEAKQKADQEFREFLRKFQVEQSGRLQIAEAKDQSGRPVDPDTGLPLPKLSAAVEKQLADLSGEEQTARSIQTQAMSALQMLENFGETGLTSAALSFAGPLAPETQNLEAALNELAVQKVIAVAKEAGARSADSDAERNAIAITAPSIGKDENVNRRIILGMASQAARSEFLNRARQEHIRKEGSLSGFNPSELDERIQTVFDPKTVEVIVLEKGAQIPEGMLPIRELLMPVRSGRPNAEGSSSRSPVATGRVRVRDPRSGRIADIPSEKLDEALRRGLERAD